jgi:hypothetical protein
VSEPVTLESTIEETIRFLHMIAETDRLVLGGADLGVQANLLLSRLAAAPGPDIDSACTEAHHFVFTLLPSRAVSDFQLPDHACRLWRLLAELFVARSLPHAAAAAYDDGTATPTAWPHCAERVRIPRRRHRCRRCRRPRAPASRELRRWHAHGAGLDFRRNRPGAGHSRLQWHRGTAVCEHELVRARSALVLALCLLLVVVRGTGAHAHLLHDHGAGLVPGLHGVTVTTASEGTAEHLAAHLHHGDIDVDSLVKQASGLPSLQLPAAIVAFIVSGLLLSLPRLLLLTQQPPLRPPSHRRWRYFTPPSHAPPVIA